MKKIMMKNDWRFWIEDDSFALVWDVPQSAEKIELPHDAMILGCVDPSSRNGRNTGFRNGDNYVYIKQLYVEESCKNQTLMMKFEGVYMNAFVYVNGQLTAKNNYGYTPFYICLNDYVRYGTENEIRVLVRAGAMPNSRWYSGAGIYRDVYLLTGGLTHLIPGGIRIHTEQADDDIAVIQIDAEINNRNYENIEFNMVTTIIDQGQNKVAENTVPLMLGGNEQNTFSQHLTIERALLWDDEVPNLYSCRITLESSGTGKKLDEDMEIFGIRTVSLDSVRGFCVNNKPEKLRGACIHHDSGILGTATYDDVQYRQIRKLKEAGFNAVRMAHHPMAPAMLRACDELGMYVMDEAFDMWSRCKSDFDYGLYFGECWEKDIEAMVRQDYNHPSVIMYSLGNEIAELSNGQGRKVCSRLNKKVKELDATRYTLTAVNGAFVAGNRLNEMVSELIAEFYPEGEISGNVNDFLSLLGEHMAEVVRHDVITDSLDKIYGLTDLAGYNYMHYRYDNDIEKYPNRIIVGSETCPPHIVDIWPLVKKYPRIIGDFTWTGWDYIGEAGVGSISYEGQDESCDLWPAQTAEVGDFDLTGFRLPISYLREIVFGRRTNPYIAVQNPHHYGEDRHMSLWCLGDALENWSWDYEEGKPVIVEVYSAGTEVELIKNGVSQGRKAAGEGARYRALFETTYEKGKLEAVSYDGERELGRSVLSSVRGEIQLCVNAEKEERKWPYFVKNAVLCFIHIQLCDLDGVVDMEHDVSISLEIDGKAKLLGFGSGNPKSESNYNGYECRTFHGRALAIIDKGENQGKCRVIIKTADGKRAECCC